MAKIHLDRIKQRYGWTGEKYQQLMGKIIANNSKRIHNSVLQVDHYHLEESMRKVKTKGSALNLPRLLDVVKPQSVWTRKGADRGKLITDNLRDRIAGNIKAILDKPEYMRTRGKLTGTLKNQAIRDMREGLIKTFENYTKVDPSIGIPKNIKTITSVEIRSVVNQTKNEYMEKLKRHNPDVKMIKRWIHNGNVFGSKTYKARKYHKELHGKEVPFYSNFRIRDEKAHIFYDAPYPHHESLPISQVAGCECEVQYIARKAIKESMVEKAWQLKSGKWHDYDSSGKVIEVSAPGQREKKIEENPKEEKRPENKIYKFSHGAYFIQKNPEILIDEILKKIGEDYSGAIGIRGIYKEELNLVELERSFVWETTGDDPRGGVPGEADAEKKRQLKGTSSFLLSGNWQDNSISTIKNNISKNILKALNWGDTDYIAIIKGDLAIDEQWDDIGEAVIDNAEVIMYIPKEKTESDNQKIMPKQEKKESEPVHFTSSGETSDGGVKINFSDGDSKIYSKEKLKELGFGKLLELAQNEKKEESKKEQNLRKKYNLENNEDIKKIAIKVLKDILEKEKLKKD